MSHDNPADQNLQDTKGIRDSLTAIGANMEDATYFTMEVKPQHVKALLDDLVREPVPCDQTPTIE